MCRKPLLAALAALALSCGVASAADLSKIERRITKEPAYKGKPQFCLLVFGNEAKSRVWIVQDDDVLYVDRNGNGDLTEADERIKAKQATSENSVFELDEFRDGSMTHKKLVVTRQRVGQDYVTDIKEFKRIAAANAEPWIWTVGVDAERAVEPADGLPARVRYIANGDGLGFLMFGNRMQDAPIIHFNGPWSVGLQSKDQRLTMDKPAMLQIGIGTQGVGPGTFSFVLYPGLIPEDAFPEAEIQFPGKSPAESGPKVKFTLKKRC